MFFAACDAMLHARSEGETFGLAVAEFSLRNKPVITYDGEMHGYSRAHVNILSDVGYYYHDFESLRTVVASLIEGIPKRNWNAYKQYRREEIIAKFKKVFIDPAHSWWKRVEDAGIMDVWSDDFPDLPELSGPFGDSCW